MLRNLPGASVTSASYPEVVMGDSFDRFTEGNGTSQGCKTDKRRQKVDQIQTSQTSQLQGLVGLVPAELTDAQRAELAAHRPVHTAQYKQKRCVLCRHYKLTTRAGWKILTQYRCEKCDVALCTGNRNCFFLYHKLLMESKIGSMDTTSE